ncbi:MAG: DUF4198 domain-containing protein [Pseudomonadota bacterium]|nr:DUF4198 domain-containing protein [Pseudomonadota bacterium]
MLRAAFGLIGALALGLAAPASAHDFFLLPEQFNVPRPGQTTIRATVSAAFPQLETVVAADRIRHVGASGPGAPQLIMAVPLSNATALTLIAPRPGVVVAGASIHPRDVDYAEDRIDLIMQEYRVAPEAAAAVRSLPNPRTLRVSSRRFAKTIICVGRCGDWPTAQRALGMPLEFVSVGSALDHFRLLRNGQPLPNYPVDLAHQDGRRIHLNTDQRGIVHLPTSARGAVMLFAAVMERPAAGERFGLDLSSLTVNR